MLHARDSEATPISDRFSLEDVIAGLAGDLNELRRGAITVPDALARAEIARQIMNGVRLVVTAQKFFQQQAKLANPEVGQDPQP